MKSKADIETIRAILESDESQRKGDLLDELELWLHECDIFPFGALLPALADANSDVRERTLKLLRYCEKFSDEEYLVVLRMIEDPDEGVRQIAFETIVVVFSGLPSSILSQGLSYLWHPTAGVRETAAQLFSKFSYQITESTYLQVAEAYGAIGLLERRAIFEFLEQHGYESLIYGLKGES